MFDDESSGLSSFIRLLNDSNCISFLNPPLYIYQYLTLNTLSGNRVRVSINRNYVIQS